MLLADPSLPLTVIEFEEWGRPQDQAAYDNILSFSPVDNVARQPYPHLLLTAGRHSWTMCDDSLQHLLLSSVSL